MWIDIKTGLVVRTHSDARAARRNWSAPNELTDAMLLDQGFMPITPTPAALLDPATQVAVELPPVAINGVWTQAWRIDNRPVAEVIAALAQAKEAAIAKVYPDVDAIYDLAIGRRATEYAEAEAGARAFMADQTITQVSGYVSGFAVDNPTGVVQSNLWSAMQIIGRADAFKKAQLDMRTVRFTAQKAMRVAVTKTQLDAAVHDWNGFISKVRQNLGL